MPKHRGPTPGGNQSENPDPNKPLTQEELERFFTKAQMTAEFLAEQMKIDAYNLMTKDGQRGLVGQTMAALQSGRPVTVIRKKVQGNCRAYLIHVHKPTEKLAGVLVCKDCGEVSVKLLEGAKF